MPTQQDEQVYGSDMLADFNRFIDERVNQTVGRTLAQQQIQRAHDTVMRVLDADPQLAGKWRVINEQPEFLAWLAGIDDLSGRPRKDLLTSAYEAGSAERCRAIFAAFQARGVTPDERGQPQPYGDGRRPSGPRSADVGGKYTRAQIASFYKDVARGLYAGREADRLRVERDIIAASQTPGRIIDLPFRGADK
jgi:hypothetical protein